jgi:hypothetical protein
MTAELPSPPFIEVPGIHNFRDIGDGHLVKTGLVFRSADPTKATEAGLEKMSQDLGKVRLQPLHCTSCIYTVH